MAFRTLFTDAPFLRGRSLAVEAEEAALALRALCGMPRRGTGARERWPGQEGARWV